MIVAAFVWLALFTLVLVRWGPVVTVTITYDARQLEKCRMCDGSGMLTSGACFGCDGKGVAKT